MEETYIRENLEQIEKRIQAACDRSHRRREEVLLIAVSKTKPASMVREAMEAGIRDFGENKVQELCEKAAVIEDFSGKPVRNEVFSGQPETQAQLAGRPLNWHLIGHLQRNKVKYVVDRACLIHSVDSLRLAEEIQKEAEKKDCHVDILIEVNIGDEESKSGIPKEEAVELVKAVASLFRVHIKGLMAIAPIVSEPEESRPYFREMARLREEIGSMRLPGVEMRELSMGMTGDFEVAIEEGATMVRVGTAIFGGRNYNR